MRWECRGRYRRVEEMMEALGELVEVDQVHLPLVIPLELAAAPVHEAFKHWFPLGHFRKEAAQNKR